jgi:hypothetical protein
MNSPAVASTGTLSAVSVGLHPVIGPPVAFVRAMPPRDWSM